MDIDTAYKAFGGPLTMLLESAYAIGMIDINMKNGNWPQFYNLISTTDHNGFFSNTAYDQGGAPDFGPTRSTNGHKEEFNWYRSNFGELGGEEITLAGSGRNIGPNPPAFGSHFLSYGAPHIEGPWHGGDLTVDSVVNLYITDDVLDIVSIAGDITVPPVGGHLMVRTFKDALKNIPPSKTNPLQLKKVLAVMGSTDGFGYAAHPFSEKFGWSTEYFNEALGWNSKGIIRKGSHQISSSGKDFVYKGSQVWNGKIDRAAVKINEKISKKLNPFGNDPAQQFDWKDKWDEKLGIESEGMSKYLKHVADGLKVSFSDKPGHLFIRKVYMSAGTDAHGDFNYSTSIPATVGLAALNMPLKIYGVPCVPGIPCIPCLPLTGIPGIPCIEDPVGLPGTPGIFTASINEFTDLIGTPINIMSLDSNAFGRVRTYALASDRGIKAGEFHAPPLRGDDRDTTSTSTNTTSSTGSEVVRHSNLAALAYRDGNTVLTDGPICIFHLDSNCRLDSDSKQLAWHDSVCKFENYDGAIGGKGNFDGARTALVPQAKDGMLDAGEVQIQTKWKGKNDYIYSENDTSEMKLDILNIGRKGDIKVISMPSGEESELSYSSPANYPLRQINFDPSALILRGKKGVKEKSSICLTNPIWTVPYKIDIKRPSKCPIKPGELRVSISFGVSMNATIDDQSRCMSNNCVFDSNGASNVYRGARIGIYALDAKGRSVGNPEYLSNRKWSVNDTGDNVPKIYDAKLGATNAKAIPCPDSRWNSDTHSSNRSERIVSYAVVASELYDMNFNHLNAIGKSFSVKNPSLALFSESSTHGDRGTQVVTPNE